jgi:hypothetical protein
LNFERRIHICLAFGNFFLATSIGKLFVTPQSTKRAQSYSIGANIPGKAMLHNTGFINSQELYTINFHFKRSVHHTYNGISSCSKFLLISHLIIFSIVHSFINPFIGKREIFLIENNQLSIYLLNIASAFHQLNQYAHVSAHALTPYTASIFSFIHFSSIALRIQHAYIPLDPHQEIVNTNFSSHGIFIITN